MKTLHPPTTGLPPKLLAAIASVACAGGMASCRILEYTAHIRPNENLRRIHITYREVRDAGLELDRSGAWKPTPCLRARVQLQ